ncbi:MAG: hypothetical protein KC636_27215 [Myxococcales bacterium]|nr:hypothetical protein [Myxococcales bacterium]
MSDEERDDLLDGLIEAASQLVVDELDEPLEAPPFAAVIGRARRLDPASVSDEWSTPHAAKTRAASERSSDPLALFLDAARDDAEADIRGHIALVGDNPPHAPALRPSAAPRRWTRIVIGLAAAAAVALAVLDGLDDRVFATRGGASQGLFQSVVDRLFSRTSAGGEAVHHDAPPSPAPTRAARDRRDEPAATVEAPTPAPAPEPERDSEAIDEIDEIDAPAIEEPAARPKEQVRPSAPPRPTLADLLQALDDDAEAALADGDIATADALYQEIIRRGGRSRRVERAYGDRFTIARRTADLEARVALWQEYLEQFPRGRYAEDASAGLCHAQDTRDASSASTCWRAYLERFPDGVYSARARRALGEPGDGDDRGTPTP